MYLYISQKNKQFLSCLMWKVFKAVIMHPKWIVTIVGVDP